MYMHKYIYHLQMPIWFWVLIAIAIMWSLFWKGAALWHAARKNDSAWFVILLIFNTLGILELFYLYGVSKVKNDKLFK